MNEAIKARDQICANWGFSPDRALEMTKAEQPWYGFLFTGSGYHHVLARVVGRTVNIPIANITTLISGVAQLLTECPRRPLQDQFQVFKRITRYTWKHLYENTVDGLSIIWNANTVIVPARNMARLSSSHLYTQSAIEPGPAKTLYGWFSPFSMNRALNFYSLAGECAGQSNLFLALYHQLETKIADPEQRLIQAARMFQKGSPELATWMQAFHSTSSLSLLMLLRLLNPLLYLSLLWIPVAATFTDFEGDVYNRIKKDFGSTWSERIKMFTEQWITHQRDKNTNDAAMEIAQLRCTSSTMFRSMGWLIHNRYGYLISKRRWTPLGMEKLNPGSYQVTIVGPKSGDTGHTLAYVKLSQSLGYVFDSNTMGLQRVSGKQDLHNAFKPYALTYFDLNFTRVKPRGLLDALPPVRLAQNLLRC